MIAAPALISVVYSSTARHPFDGGRLEELLAQSRAANRRSGLTGMLLYRAGRFIQVLEGPEETVRDLVSRIRSDPRHTDMRVLLQERITERRFSDWTMGYEPISSSHEPTPDGFRDTFEDLEAADDASATIRAVRELTIWFHARSA